MNSEAGSSEFDRESLILVEPADELVTAGGLLILADGNSVRARHFGKVLDSDSSRSPSKWSPLIRWLPIEQLQRA